MSKTKTLIMSRRSKNVVKATEADVVCPTVAAEDPEGLLGEEALVSKDFLSCWSQTTQLNTKGLRSFLEAASLTRTQSMP